MSEKRMIHFKNEENGIEVSIPDGGMLRLFSENGDAQCVLCRYVDEKHTEIDGVLYMVSSRYSVDTRAFRFDKLPKEYEGMDAQALKGELGSMRDVLGEIQSEMYKSLEKNKPAKSKEQER